MGLFSIEGTVYPFVVFSRKHLAGAAQALALAAFASDPATALAGEAGEAFFEAQIRPLLIAECGKCHGEKANGGLKLDSPEAILRGSNSGKVMVPGNPDESLLIKAVRRVDDLDMPPDEPLAPHKVALLERWVKAGAPMPKAAAPADTAAFVKPEHKAFWSFQPLRPVPVPAVKNETAVKSPIDAFVLARLQAEGMTPTPPAARETLLRRVTFDLIGLPPTPAELDAFLADKSPQAYAKVVDRLLASPHYGERWGRHWLDVMRYAEQDVGGARYDHAFRYRDFVVEAFNRDMPYDSFVRAHIAGDLLEPRAKLGNTPMAVATGWAALGPYYYGMGGVAKSVAEELQDRVDTLSRGFLGLTVACARCHDHKYDPISLRDYYGIAGVFWRSHYAERSLATALETERAKAHGVLVRRAKERLKEFETTQAKLLYTALAYQTGAYMEAAWQVLVNAQPAAAHPQGLDEETLSRWISYLQPAKERNHGFLNDWDKAIASARKGHRVPAARVHAVAQAFASTVIKALQLVQDTEAENQAVLAKYVKRRPADAFRQNYAEHETVAPNKVEVKAVSREHKNLFVDLFVDWKNETGEGIPAQDGVLLYAGNKITRWLHGPAASLYATLQADVKALEAAAPPPVPTIATLEDVERESPNMRVHVRGNPALLGDEVPRRFLTVLSEQAPTAYAQGSGRRELAEHVAMHPLATRVYVNRVWAQHFGRGLVTTTSNFGTLGERPSHPELLEWLAYAFVANGQSTKWLHRTILLSSTYQLSGRWEPAYADKDPQARLLWRHPRRRIEVEVLRDSLLGASGQLDMKVGGPSAQSLHESHRRTLYASISRQQQDPFLALFDFPDPGFTAEQRQSTTVPSQGLFFLNSPFVQQQSALVAARLPKGKPALRITEAYRLLFARVPNPKELQLAESFVASGTDDVWSAFVQALIATSEFCHVD